MKKVSIIVPVYNTSKYLRKCLDSLVNQTLSDIEIIIINDCSTDDSKCILDEYEKKYDDKIKVIHNKINKGIGYNRNLGIEKSDAEFIAFVDSDDFVDETMYEKLYTKAVNESLDLVLCNFHKILEKSDGEIEEIKPDFVIPQFDNTVLEKSPNLLLDVNLAPWNKLYKKSLLGKSIRFPEGLKYEDAIVVVMALGNAKKIGVVTEQLNYYLVRSKSETTIMNEKVFDIIKISDMIITYLKTKHYYDKIKYFVEAFMIRNLFRYTLQQRYQSDKKIGNKFIDETFIFLNKNFSDWKNNKIWKRRSFAKRFIESSKLLTKLYCRI